MLTVKEIKDFHDKGYVHGQTTREKAADDIMFYWITHWDDQFIAGSTLQFRGQFDILRKAGRQIITDIKANPTQVDFQPSDGSDDDLADIMDGRYRADSRDNSATEAKENATMEAIVCGVGAWERCTEYETNKQGDVNQVIKRKPIYEANNNLFWDSNAKLADKSDANWVSHLEPYSEGGYKKLVEELTGEESMPSSFSTPEHSYTFPWVSSSEVYYVARFFYKEKTTQKYMLYKDMFGSEIFINAGETEPEGFFFDSEIEKDSYKIHRYIVGGDDTILDHTIIPGDQIPIIPVYGERAFVEGEEHYEGITRLAKDPQRLRNFVMSYLADVVAKSPRVRPVYFPEQISGFEHMYEENGADAEFPYLLQRRKSLDGDDLPLGAIAATPEQPAPTALYQLDAMSRQAVDDVASANLPKDIQDMDLSGEALVQLQKMFDKQSYTYQHNLKSALRRDAEVYQSMHAAIHDVEKDVTIIKPDGTRVVETINQQEVDLQTLQLVVNNDMKNAKFNVYAEIGQSYSSVQEQDRKELKEMINQEAPDSPMRNIMQLTYMTMKDGESFKSMRKYAREQLILQGINEPETDEEKQMLAKAQQQQANQQNPQEQLAMMEGQARIMEGQAAIEDKKIDMYNAQTKRMQIPINQQLANAKAAEAGVNMRLKIAQTESANIDNAVKFTGQSLRQSVGA